MGERVNIQYSVDMDDLPSEIVRLVARAIADLNDVASATSEQNINTDGVLSLRTIQVVEEVRQELATIDVRLGDIINLINGYVTYKSDLINQQQIANLTPAEDENTD
jgi:hypothetical protein